MKALFSFLSCLIMLALFTRCADDELDGPSDGLPDKGLVVRLSTGGGLETKTPLNSTGAYHHVKEVWAVLYKLDASATDPTDNGNYEFITAEKLDWNPSKPAPDRSEYPSEEAYRAAYEQYVLETGGAYGNGSPQQKDFELHSDENGTLLDAGIYRVLCVGLDDMSGTVYNLKTGDQLNEEIFATGKTLADAVATITDIKQAFEGELFAGWAEFQFEPDNLNIVEVEMKRRVAGVLCYVTDIPKVITADGEQPVKGIRLALYTEENESEDGSKKGLNNQIHLCRLEGNEERMRDFGTLTNDASWSAPDENGYTTLAYYALPDQSGDTGHDTYQFDWEGTMKQLLESEGVSLKNNSLLMGAYVIPIKKGSTPTLVVQLIGGDNVDYAEGNSNSPQEVEEGQAENGEVLATFNATRSTAGVETGTDFDLYRYDILPNYIYHIGNKPEPDGTDKDEPVSLLGQKITVTPEPWKGQDVINVEYPSVPIVVRMDVPYGEEYIFDCIPHEMTIRVVNSVLNTPWELRVESGSMGIYFWNETRGEWRSTYVPDSKDVTDNPYVDVKVLLTDYAVLNPPASEERVIPVGLYSNGEKIGSHEFKQYSAIVLEMEDRNGNTVHRGFSRFDYGTVRDLNDGSIDSDGEYYQWGYDLRRTHLYIYGTYPDDYNGETNLTNAKNEANSSGGEKLNYFENSAMHAVELPCYQSETDNAKETTHKWYLPAFYEQQAFMDMAVEKSELEAWHIVPFRTENDKYWTSSVLQDDYLKTAYAFYINDKGEVDYNTRGSGDYRTNQYRMRRACVIQ